MIDTLAIPILLKAVEFLFGEGSKILKERRERRKAQSEAEKKMPESLTLQSTDTTQPSEAIQSKEAAFSQPIAETAWLDSETKIKHLLALLEIHTKNYYLAKEQCAKWGSALVPSIILHNLADAENEIAATTKELQSALSKVYGKKIAAPGVEEA